MSNYKLKSDFTGIDETEPKQFKVIQNTCQTTNQTTIFAHTHAPANTCAHTHTITRPNHKNAKHRETPRKTSPARQTHTHNNTQQRETQVSDEANNNHMFVCLSPNEIWPQKEVLGLHLCRRKKQLQRSEETWSISPWRPFLWRYYRTGHVDSWCFFF